MTHVAGTVAANGLIKGIAPDATLLAYRVLGPGGTGSTANVIAGIERAVQDGDGAENVQFLKKRMEALSNNTLFHGMEYTEDIHKLNEWMPLVMNGRKTDEPIAATKIDSGTDSLRGEK